MARQARPSSLQHRISPSMSDFMNPQRRRSQYLRPRSRRTVERLPVFQCQWASINQAQTAPAQASRKRHASALPGTLAFAIQKFRPSTQSLRKEKAARFDNGVKVGFDLLRSVWPANLQRNPGHVARLLCIATLDDCRAIACPKNTGISQGSDSDAYEVKRRQMVDHVHPVHAGRKSAMC